MIKLIKLWKVFEHMFGLGGTFNACVCVCAEEGKVRDKVDAELK